jgi:hypothetical protein
MVNVPMLNAARRRAPIRIALQMGISPLIVEQRRGLKRCSHALENAALSNAARPCATEMCTAVAMGAATVVQMGSDVSALAWRATVESIVQRLRHVQMLTAMITVRQQMRILPTDANVIVAKGIAEMIVPLIP